MVCNAIESSSVFLSVGHELNLYAITAEVYPEVRQTTVEESKRSEENTKIRNLSFALLQSCLQYLWVHLCTVLTFLLLSGKQNVECVIVFSKPSQQKLLLIREEWVFVESTFKIQCYIHKNTPSTSLIFLQFCILGNAICLSQTRYSFVKLVCCLLEVTLLLFFFPFNFRRYMFITSVFRVIYLEGWQQTHV